MADKLHTIWWGWDDFATTDASSGYVVPIVLPEGPGLVQITEFGVMAKTTYAANNSAQTFTLCNAAGATIAAVANTPATGGLAIGPTVVTGRNSAPVAATKNIDCSSAPVAIHVTTTASGVSRAMVGVCGWVQYRRVRA